MKVKRFSKQHRAQVMAQLQEVDPSTLRLDAAENRAFLRQLEHIEATVQKIDYPELKYALMLPTLMGFDPGAVKLTYRQTDSRGRAAVISDKSKRLPRVDVFGTETSATVFPLGDSFGYSIYEAIAFARAGIPLEAERAATAREVVFRLLEEIAAIGHTESGMKGLLNHSDIGAATAPNGAAASPLWSSKTALEKLADLNLLVQTVRDQTLGIEAPNAITMPESHYTQIAQERLGDSSDTTVLKHFLATNPWVKEIEPWHFASTAGSGSTARLLAYRKDPNKVKLRCPHAYQQLPPQLNGLEYEVACHMSTQGVVLYKPKSAYALDGV